ncbi:MAG: hypothetical protein ACI84O_001524 [Myxococcota bacterium]|jgi:hypothetical protein
MRVFLIIMLAACGAGYFLFTVKTKDLRPDYSQPRQYSGEVVEAVKQDLRPRHMQDERWEGVVETVENAEQRFNDAVKQHYGGEEGDFLQFRSSREAILADLEASLLILEDMLFICRNSKSSTVEITKQYLRADKLAVDIKHDLRR